MKYTLTTHKHRGEKESYDILLHIGGQKIDIGELRFIMGEYLCTLTVHNTQTSEGPLKRFSESFPISANSTTHAKKIVFRRIKELIDKRKII